MPVVFTSQHVFSVLSLYSPFPDLLGLSHTPPARGELWNLCCALLPSLLPLRAPALLFSLEIFLKFTQSLIVLDDQNSSSGIKLLEMILTVLCDPATLLASCTHRPHSHSPPAIPTALHFHKRMSLFPSSGLLYWPFPTLPWLQSKSFLIPQLKYQSSLASKS